MKWKNLFSITLFVFSVSMPLYGMNRSQAFFADQEKNQLHSYATKLFSKKLCIQTQSKFAIPYVNPNNKINDLELLEKKLVEASDNKNNEQLLNCIDLHLQESYKHNTKGQPLNEIKPIDRSLPLYFEKIKTALSRDLLADFFHKHLLKLYNEPNKHYKIVFDNYLGLLGWLINNCSSIKDIDFLISEATFYEKMLYDNFLNKNYDPQYHNEFRAIFKMLTCDTMKMPQQKTFINLLADKYPDLINKSVFHNNILEWYSVNSHEFIKAMGQREVAIFDLSTDQERTFAKSFFDIRHAIRNELTHDDNGKPLKAVQNYLYKETVKNNFLAIGLYASLYPQSLNQQLAQKYNNISNTIRAHLSKNAKSVWKENIKFINQKELNSMMHKFNDAIKKFESEGYIPFVHAQRSRYQLPEELATLLWSIHQDQIISDYIFLHVSEDLFKDSSKNHSFYREKIISSEAYNKAERGNLLFLNYTFFGNSSNFGSCSSRFILANSNVKEIRLNFKDIFTFAGLQSVYPKYQSELDALQKSRLDISNYGTMLLIAIPKDIVKKVVYPASANGYRESVTIDGIGKSDDTSIIIDALHNRPETIKNTDQIEFCMVMSQDIYGGLNPKSGIKVIPFISGPEEKIVAYEHQKADLFARIEKDVKKELLSRRKPHAKR